MNHYPYVLVGGGVASVHASLGIRDHDTTGRIVIVGDEPNPPTDRPPLSKQFLVNDEWTPDDPVNRPGTR
jgi:3-phenylpropionate/trans-cinnamate dioxygenase ferredoxin reductase subunit